MERKNVSAILVNDFEVFLKEKMLYQKYISGELLCSQCGTAITSENIAIIYYKDGYKFCCDRTECLGKIQKG